MTSTFIFASGTCFLNIPLQPTPRQDETTNGNKGSPLLQSLCSQKHIIFNPPLYRSIPHHPSTINACILLYPPPPPQSLFLLLHRRSNRSIALQCSCLIVVGPPRSLSPSPPYEPPPPRLHRTMSIHRHHPTKYIPAVPRYRLRGRHIRRERRTLTDHEVRKGNRPHARRAQNRRRT